MRRPSLSRACATLYPSSVDVGRARHRREREHETATLAILASSIEQETPCRYAEAAKQGYLVGSAHLSFPGLGHLRAAGKGHVFVPVNYSGLK